MKPEEAASSASRAFQILHVALTILFLLTGIDKVFHLVINWNQYLAPVFLRILGEHAALFMRATGAGEIALAFGLLFRPARFSLVATAWFCVIIVNLLLTGAFYDIALRDFTIALASVAAGLLARAESGRSRAV